jgi:hypothetical protein
MHMKNYRWILALTMLVVLSMACAALGGGGGDAAPTSSSGGGGAGGGAGGGGGSFDTDFPVPGDASEFVDLGDDAVNFQTGMSVSESLEFYRAELTARGLTERTITTATTDATFSVVFDGDPSGKAVVVQGVDLGNGKTNINIRYEDV